jgi:hypothetical protein
MGWTRREFYLGEHAPHLFDRTGNISPTVWLNGRIIGGWGQRKDGEVAFRIFEDVGSEIALSIAEAAQSLSEKLGPVRLSARGRATSPIERELLT